MAFSCPKFHNRRFRIRQHFRALIHRLGAGCGHLCTTPLACKQVCIGDVETLAFFFFLHFPDHHHHHLILFFF
uniref:Uncharacterized protein n=1 Tax=Octopus bimaculoides TaxID=37653 RepID=A0A0L8GME0_OCTBM